MWEDVKPVQNPHADLILQHAKLMASGEIAAGHFECQSRVKSIANDLWVQCATPSWGLGYEYRIVEGKNNPSKRHDTIKAEWEAVKDKGTHEIFCRHSFTCPTWELVRIPNFMPNCDYEIRPIAKLKLIDKTKLPIGTMTNYGRLMALSENWNCQCFSTEDGAVYLCFSELRIKPMTEWLSWHGGACPVPAGLIFDAILRDGQRIDGNSVQASTFSRTFEHVWCEGDIIAYRIVGIADGWTDDPTLAA